MKETLVSLFLLITLTATAQQNSDRTGQWYVYWGWNGSKYTTSDIRFEGGDHSFTLFDVVADHRQTEFSLKKYFHPEYFTTPQYNFRIGKFLKNNWDVSFGIDHMKYVVRQGQLTSISGTIDDLNSNYTGVYDRADITIISDLLKYEHTDGLNFVNFALRKSNPLTDMTKAISIEATYGAGIGGYLPKSDVTLLGKTRNDAIHLSGYGADIMGGLRINIKRRWFIQSEVKLGYVNLPNVRTTENKNTKASQHFNYFQYNILFGGHMFLKKVKTPE